MYRFNDQAVECIHSMTNPLNLYIQCLSTFNTTYIYVRKYQYQVTVVNNLEINVNVSLNISFALWNYDADVVMD